MVDGRGYAQIRVDGEVDESDTKKAISRHCSGLSRSPDAVPMIPLENFFQGGDPGEKIEEEIDIETLL